MTEMFNATTYGNGFEGFVNWTNLIANGWMISIFILAVSAVGYIVGKKQGMSSSSALVMAGILIVILTPLFQLFTVVNGQIIIAGLIMVGLGVGGYFIGR
ncbi:MAG: hypothetical protein EOL97_07075 [Spirochaetia bacterium]|nr:hypothetical protein [Spirochaetia bacterium]